MLEDLHVGAVIHELLQGGLHGLGSVGIALLDGHGLLGHADILAKGLQRILGLRDGVAGDRRVRIEHVGLAGGHVGGHIGLQLVGQDLDVLLAVGLALLLGLVDFLFLGGAGLHRDLESAQAGGIHLIRIVLLDDPRGAGLEHAHEVDGLHTLLGDGEGGDADVILGPDGWNDRIEVGGLRIRFQAEDVGQRLGDVHIEADGGLAVFGKEFRRSVRSVHADGQLTVLRHRIRQHCGDVVVLLHAGDIVTGGARRRA